jgi:hypothetical protein
MDHRLFGRVVAVRGDILIFLWEEEEEERTTYQECGVIPWLLVGPLHCWWSLVMSRHIRVAAEGL